MFAYVRYIDDNIRQIVPLDYIKDFCPQDVNDFEIKKKYHILWKKSPEDQGQYYKAQILKLAESEEELTRERISIPPLDSDEEDCSSYKNSMNPSCDKTNDKTKKKAAVQNTHKKKNLMDILKEKKKVVQSSFESNMEYVPIAVHKELQDKYYNLKKRMREEEMANEENGKKIKCLKEEKREMKAELLQLRKLNLHLQEELFLNKKITDNETSSAVHTPLLQRAEKTADMQTAIIPKITQKTSSSSHTHLTEHHGLEEPAEELTTGRCKDGKDLGHGVMISTEKWDIVRRVVGDSKFCKSLAVVIWGTTVLKQRSVTGMKCNAKKTADAKPPLTPEKVSAIKECLSQRLKERGHTSEEINKRLLSVRKYLAEKISDINRIKTVSGMHRFQVQ
ncbi:BEN domain-containing protein 5-like isoform X2 [Megalobrama amblycephala]|uniref:BEN domain-containing protein 5-like isoform X2 n=1 Tax=Megalobrama amblycephala TaxID=75352 RepID=UPI002014179F|nr:BEN domain-containing protein 5-like isoform X2 [Megalobrama amblycephala]